MVNCIYCGNELEIMREQNEYILIKGYKCTNEACPNPVKEWNLAEHRDNQNWNVRHTRALEAEIDTIGKEYKLEFDKINMLMGSLVVKLGELEEKITTLGTRVKSIEDSIVIQ